MRGRVRSARVVVAFVPSIHAAMPLHGGAPPPCPPPLLSRGRGDFFLCAARTSPTSAGDHKGRPYNTHFTWRGLPAITQYPMNLRRTHKRLLRRVWRMCYLRLHLFTLRRHTAPAAFSSVAHFQEYL